MSASQDRAQDPKSAPRFSLDAEVRKFATVKEEIDYGDYKIRQAFARYMVILFIVTNAFVMIGLGLVFWRDCIDLAAARIKPGDRIINPSVIVTLLGATTVQLGTVIYTIARSIFQVRLPTRKS